MNLALVLLVCCVVDGDMDLAGGRLGEEETVP